MTPPRPPTGQELLVHLACTSASCCAADAVCLPFDLLKVRMQLQNELLPARAAPDRLGVAAMAARVWRTEGAAGFFAGLPAAMLRQATYGGPSFFAYPYVRDALAGLRERAAAPPLWSKLAAGALAGGAAVSAAVCARRLNVLASSSASARMRRASACAAAMM